MTVTALPQIDLAPMHKLGFVAHSPILLAAGVIGAGDTVMAGLELSELGGVVIGPVLRKAHGGTAPPRLAESSGMIVLDVGLQNRGLSAILKRYASSWSRLGSPVIVQLADTDPHALGRVAEALSGIEQVAALELAFPAQLPENTTARRWLEQALRALTEHSDLPIWVKLPLHDRRIGRWAVDYGVVGLVVGQPPVGTLPYAALSAAKEPGNLVRGALYGPAVYPLMLTALTELVQLQLPATLIACGGIHTVDQARQALALGASAVQIDSAAWIEPGLPFRLHKALCSES